MIWHTADPHFGHDGVIPTFRGFSNSIEMGIKIIANINELVSATDTLYIHGDFAMTDNFKEIKGWFDLLNGKKHLILGNHDKLNPFQYVEMGFLTVSTAIEKDDMVYCHDPSYAVVDVNRWWLCGHVHHMPKKVYNIINVGLDAWDIKPVSALQIKDLVSKKPTRSVTEKLKILLDDEGSIDQDTITQTLERR